MDTKIKEPRQTRCRYIVGGTIIIAIVVAVAVTLGLVYGLRPDYDREIQLRVISVRSDGLVGDTTKVTVEYKAARNHSVNWRTIRFTGQDVLHDAKGQLTTTMKNGINVFHSSYIISVKNDKLVYIAIHSNIESFNMQFNITTLSSAWIYTLPQWKNKFVRITPRVKAPSVGDLNFTMTVDIDESKPTDPITSGYTLALNTSTNPPTIFDQFDYDNIALNISLESTLNATHLIVSLTHELIQYGAILTVQFREETDTNFIDTLYHGLSVEIVPLNDTDVIPRDACGLYDVKKIPFYKNTLQVRCFAMGNPLSEIQVLKESSENKYDVMVSDTVYTEKWMGMEVVTLHDKKTQTGNYMCRAKCGNQVVDLQMEVFAAETIKFIANETGVLENTTTKIVVQCSVTGFPVPDLTFWLFYPHGSDMIQSGRYEYERNKTETTASLTMTISPVDTGIHQVVCVDREVVTQAKRTWDSSTTIVLFPASAT